ncbi:MULTISPECIES: aldehyde dehydrogenase family protein [unclassified Bradyrhizobium]|uniref:aldehyde dehydrogenase family protein n=1 Tax=unclassified Bradyrhizobium TaxID=2631580 RepID=UPI0028E90F7A|nr:MULTISPECIES: aldehyde dehydrogenase family protein [unclassified Bradyrhizobium]
MLKASLIIDGAERPGAAGQFERRSAISGDLVTEAAAATPEQAIEAVASCAAAFPAWAATAPAAKRDILLKAAALLEARTDEFRDVMIGETGASKSWYVFNAKLAAGMLREAAGLTTHVKGEIIPSNKPGMFSMAVRRPAGVALAIAPWNAPVILAVRAFCTAIACGNTVVLKASELSPGTQFKLAQVMHDAGLPPGVLNFITHKPQDAGAVAEAMIAHPAVRRVNFTGSTRTGRIVAETCARYLKPALLELGGKAPILVLKDADIDAAVAATAFGAYMHQGQICMSTERVVVDHTVADEFGDRLAAKAKTLVAGNPLTSDVPLGGLISVQSVHRVQALIADAVGKGAKLLAGGDADGPLMNAALLDHVRPGMDIYYEESFGPVTTIVRVNDVEDAIRVANDTEYGLSSAIFTRDVGLAMAIAQRLDFGCCHINGPTVNDEAQMPLGGMKASGYGRFGGAPGIHEFTDVQWISVEDPNQHYPI